MLKVSWTLILSVNVPSAVRSCELVFFFEPVVAKRWLSAPTRYITLTLEYSALSQQLASGSPEGRQPLVQFSYHTICWLLLCVYFVFRQKYALTSDLKAWQKGRLTSMLYQTRASISNLKLVLMLLSCISYPSTRLCTRISSNIDVLAMLIKVMAIC